MTCSQNSLPQNSSLHSASSSSPAIPHPQIVPILPYGSAPRSSGYEPDSSSGCSILRRRGGSLQCAGGGRRLLPPSGGFTQVETAPSVTCRATLSGEHVDFV